MERCRLNAVLHWLYLLQGYKNSNGTSGRDPTTIFAPYGCRRMEITSTYAQRAAIHNALNIDAHVGSQFTESQNARSPAACYTARSLLSGVCRDYAKVSSHLASMDALRSANSDRTLYSLMGYLNILEDHCDSFTVSDGTWAISIAFWPALPGHGPDLMERENRAQCLLVIRNGRWHLDYASRK